VFFLGMYLFFCYLLSVGILLSAVLVICSKSSVYAVLSLVSAFLNVAGLFVVLGVEFIAFLLLLVYVGAIMVLFLFVLMILMLNEDELQGEKSKLVVFVFLFFFLFLFCFQLGQVTFPNWGANERGIVLLGRGLYIEYGEGFIAGSLILLLAMIGVVELVGDLI